MVMLLLPGIRLYAQHNEVPPTTDFEVTGAVKKSLKISISDLAAFKQDTLGDVIIRNNRGEQKGVAKQLKGIMLKTILDSAAITADKPKEYSEYVIKLIASDGYVNVYSWNELYNTDIGARVYLITEMDGKPIGQVPGRILVMSLADNNPARRHLKGLAKIEVKKVP